VNFTLHSATKKLQPNPNGFHVNENTEASIEYQASDGTKHIIQFSNLLKTGYNMDKFIKDKTLFKRPDHQFQLMLSTIKKGSVVYDLGAYIGTFSIPFAIEGMKVYAFEAWPDNHIRCREHTHPYGVTNFCVALSDKNKIEKGQITHCKGWANHDRELFEEIKYIRLDDFIAEQQLPLPDFIKMDIEGMESIAMHGMTNLLENVRPVWSVGYHFKMPVEVEGVAWVDVKDGGFDFNKIGQLDYLIFDAMTGDGYYPDILQQQGGEYIFIPKEKMNEIQTR
tara:strand:+ start:76 stop:915 length:840 start_codon:yes stop_codon:yes gene_type:complete